MDSETPFADDGPNDGDEVPYKWLDEWLCEYVDGTMDPSLEAIFEQYVEANPDLKAHVQRLKKTRKLLCEHSLPPPSLETDDPVPEPGSEPSPPAPPPRSRLWDRPFVMAGMASSITVALVVGFFIGVTVVESDRFYAPTSAVESVSPDRAPSAKQDPAPGSVPVFLEHDLSSSPDSSQSTSSLTTIGAP